MKAIKLSSLVRYLNELLTPEQFRDYTVNGLQVEGRDTVSKLVTGVSANQAFLEAAIKAGADAVLVHHGYFWNGEDPRLTGAKGRRIKTLLEKNVSLLAYHLPLDYHLNYGNNAQLARVLQLAIKNSQSSPGTQGSIFQGTLPKPMPGNEFAQHIAACLGRAPLHIANDPHGVIRTIGWCTGAAYEFIPQALEEGLDAYITGEVPERAVDVAKENNLQLFVAGHHATERYGVQAIGQLLAQHFQIAHEFIDIDSPL